MSNTIRRVLLFFLLSAVVFVLACGGATNNKRGNSKSNEQLKPDNSPTQGKPVFNIFIENSASMFGYVQTTSAFKNSVYGLITDLKSKDLSSKINLNYINSSTFSYKQNALTTDIQYFIDRLNPGKLRQTRGNKSESNLPDVINQVIKLNPNEVNILVSDLIFSAKNGQSLSLLPMASNTIELFVSPELRKNPFSVIFLKLNSEFDGDYYQEALGGVPKPIKGERPYYIIIFGTKTSLDNFLNKINFNEYKKFESSYYLLNPQSIKIEAKILRNAKKGKFEINQSTKEKLFIKNAKPDSNGIFQFSVAADLKSLHIDETFLSNISNYEVAQGYSLESIELIKDSTNVSLKGYSHIFTLSTKDLKRSQEVFIKLKSNLPSWVKASSTSDDSDPEDKVNQSKTFGLEQIVIGFTEAWKNVYNGKEHFKLIVSVNSNSGQEEESGFPTGIILVVLFIVLLFVYLKNKR